MTAPKQKIRVFNVEDMADDAELLNRALCVAGYDVEFLRVDTRDALLQELENAPPDLILSDYTLPAMDGSQALRLARERCPDVPFIFVTGSIGEERAVDALKDGATDYVLKDRLSRLVPAVRRALAEAGERRERLEVQQRLELVFDSIPVALYLSALPHDIKLHWISENIERLTGFPRERFLDDAAFGLSRVHPEDRDRVLAEHQRIGPGRPATLEYRWQCADGTYRWFADSGYAVLNEDGTVKATAGSWLDVTERKTLQMQFVQAQKMEALGRLAGGVAHDFNNLLLAILGYAELMMDGCRQDDPRRKDLEQIVKAGHRAAGLTRQLLAFSRKQVIQPKLIDLNVVLLDLIKMLKRLIGETVELEFTAAEGIGKVKADPGQIEQVIMNLAVNARDAMPQGGRLSLRLENVELEGGEIPRRLELPSGSYVCLNVTDTGVGMGPEVQTHLFEPFFTTKEAGKGTGLGLVTCYGIIKQSGGAVAVQSEVGRGTTFRIYLPRAAAASDTDRKYATPRSLIRGKATILVVEDESGVRALMCRSLAGRGYVVLEASSGEEALRLVSAPPGRRVDLVITDVVMPNMSGVELARRLRQVEPALRILLISGYTDEAAQVDEALAHGASFLQKPFTPSVLLAKVQELVLPPSP